MDLTRVDQIVQFALARAAHEDDRRMRQLGPIHLLKYVYLADLAHARTHEGSTYTGIDWTFLHYGPWSPTVFDRLEGAAREIGAKISSIASSYDKDFTRFELDARDADDVERKLDRSLPYEIVSALKIAVRTFGNDTPGLLDWVYRTPPMLAAAPREVLDFSVARTDPGQPKAAVTPDLRRRQQKKLEAAVSAAQLEFRERRAKAKENAARPTPAAAAPPPRYDEVFAAGTAWLDEQGVVGRLEGELQFPDDIWKSEWRDPHGGE